MQSKHALFRHQKNEKENVWVCEKSVHTHTPPPRKQIPFCLKVCSRRFISPIRLVERLTSFNFVRSTTQEIKNCFWNCCLPTKPEGGKHQHNYRLAQNSFFFYHHAYWKFNCAPLIDCWLFISGVKSSTFQTSLISFCVLCTSLKGTKLGYFADLFWTKQCLEKGLYDLNVNICGDYHFSLGLTRLM